jgi:hypothetical protein
VGDDERRRTAGYPDVGGVEDRPPIISHAAVDEIDYVAKAKTINEISGCTTENEREPELLDTRSRVMARE